MIATPLDALRPVSSPQGHLRKMKHNDPATSIQIASESTAVDEVYVLMVQV